MDLNWSGLPLPGTLFRKQQVGSILHASHCTCSQVELCCPLSSTWTVQWEYKKNNQAMFQNGDRRSNFESNSNPSSTVWSYVHIHVWLISIWRKGEACLDSLFKNNTRGKALQLEQDNPTASQKGFKDLAGKDWPIPSLHEGGFWQHQTHSSLKGHSYRCHIFGKWGLGWKHVPGSVHMYKFISCGKKCHHIKNLPEAIKSL